MRVLLTHGYFLAEDAKEQQLMRPYPPLGILYLAAYLEERGIPHRSSTPPSRPRGAWQRHLSATRPGVVGIYTNLMTKRAVLGIVRFIRQQPRWLAPGWCWAGPRSLTTPKVPRARRDVIVGGRGARRP
jgi:hypothetical protein